MPSDPLYCCPPLVGLALVWLLGGAKPRSLSARFLNAIYTLQWGEAGGPLCV